MAGLDKNTVLLLHCNDSNSTATPIDECGKVFTRYGNPTFNTTIKEFGLSSICALNVNGGSADYYYTPNSTDFDFGNGDFTIDFWLYPTGLGRGGMWGGYISTGNGTNTNGNSWCIRFNNTSRIITFNLNGNGAGTNTYYNSSMTINFNQWYHIAIVRSGTTLMHFTNGNLTGTYTNFTYPVNSAGIGLRLFRSWSVNYDQYDGQGYMDEIRISKGIARWTSNFSIPIKEYTKPYKFLLQDNNALKRSNTGTSLDQVGTIPITKDLIVNQGMDDLNNINSNIINMVNSNKYKITLYKN